MPPFLKTTATIFSNGWKKKSASLLLELPFTGVVSVLSYIALPRLRLVALSPFPHGVHYRSQAFPYLGQRVFHAWGHLRIDAADNKTRILHVPQVGGKHLL